MVSLIAVGIVSLGFGALFMFVVVILVKAQKPPVANLVAPNPHMVCPHCGTKGAVRTVLTRQNAGVSGTKATAAILTSGLSLLVAGLSRTIDVTEAGCSQCRNRWTF